MRTSQTGGDWKLNFRQAERHMPGMLNGQATEYTEYHLVQNDYRFEAKSVIISTVIFY